MGGVLGSLEMQSRQARECREQIFTGDSAGSSEDQNAYRNVDSKDCAHDVLDKNEDFMRT
jgi:hypothetical protein